MAAEQKTESSDSTPILSPLQRELEFPGLSGELLRGIASAPESAFIDTSVAEGQVDAYSHLRTGTVLVRSRSPTGHAFERGDGLPRMEFADRNMDVLGKLKLTAPPSARWVLQIGNSIDLLHGTGSAVVNLLLPLVAMPYSTLHLVFQDHLTPEEKALISVETFGLWVPRSAWPQRSMPIMAALYSSFRVSVNDIRLQFADGVAGRVPE